MPKILSVALWVTFLTSPFVVIGLIRIIEQPALIQFVVTMVYALGVATFYILINRKYPVPSNVVTSYDFYVLFAIVFCLVVGNLDRTELTDIGFNFSAISKQSITEYLSIRVFFNLAGLSLLPSILAKISKWY
ncbi:hypothetical protein FHQ28_11680 [Pasteurellaceae bacterium USgator11]|nr:hypothetical protein FHQ20_11875 [Pasteurellaceae bacterium USgator41]TNG95762.1 hypothetical protein FHQ19_03510 [Pasteurellaceae bacterium UScroc12]TNG98820.1 hypothetical protein FHQ28_11680 [Pasteurellaceae bacterium USgator11]TNG99201.1 hypothetical protein FHQ24_06560 [Pasteurellaceae bacterium UScroc31]